MPCFHPISGWRSKDYGNTGKRSIVFSKTQGCEDLPVKIPCGQCIGCRQDRAKSWAIRCVHEASMFKENCFITLTFDEKHISKNYSLEKADFVKFMKRLRKKYFGNKKGHVRYFHCGEYGEKYQRPHHHACLFGFDFKDKYLWDIRGGNRLYRSKELEALWPFGFCTIGDVTYDSAAYVARYVLKKITGEMAPDVYQGRLPEYVTMSRRPGIGKMWIDKFHDEVKTYDLVWVRGNHFAKVPKYYDQQFELTDPKEFANVKAQRIVSAKLNKNNTPERLQVRESVENQKLLNKSRSLENQSSVRQKFDPVLDRSAKKKYVLKVGKNKGGSL